MRLRAGPVILVTFVLAATAACAPTAAGHRGSPAAPSAHHAMSMAAATATAQASPQRLRAQFEQFLGRHTVLAVRVMRSVVSSAPDLRQAITASMQQNTDTLNRLVASAYGGAQGDRFRQLWQRHITDLLAYADGVASRDTSAQQTARASLLAYCDAYGAWFSQASKGRIRASDAAGGVRLHVESLMKQVDAYAARDYGQAYRIEREAYEHMFTAGAALARSTVPTELAVGLGTPPEKLKSAFAMLLGEHMELVVDAQRATVAGPSEFQAAAAQLNANTTAIAKAMGAITGPRKAAEFQSAWAGHVEGLMAYTAAVAGKDEAGKAAAKATLDTAVVRLAAYFSGIVQNRLPSVTLTRVLTMHDGHLIGHIDAYVARDYNRAQQMELEGYQQMLGVADTLVGAIQRTVRPGLPVGGSQTGGGGTARRPR